MKKILTLLTIAIFVIGCSSTKPMDQSASAASAALDFGDYTSETITSRAWKAMDTGRYQNAVKYAEKCIEMFKAEAKKMQASLTEKPSENVFDYWALNDVGTSYFIMGEAYVKLGKKDEAIAAYKVLINELPFAQTWDPKGWFWAPADAAKPKLLTLMNDF